MLVTCDTSQDRARWISSICECSSLLILCEVRVGFEESITHRNIESPNMRYDDFRKSRKRYE